MQFLLSKYIVIMSKRIKTPQSQGRDYKQMPKHIETVRRELGSA